MVPVYRFWSGSSHFYTIKEGEKNKLINFLSDAWTYEGRGVLCLRAGQRRRPTSSPVYRFWKPSDNSHFYTIDPAEKGQAHQPILEHLHVRGHRLLRVAVSPARCRNCGLRIADCGLAALVLFQASNPPAGTLARSPLLGLE